jgi:hypothetical protein
MMKIGSIVSDSVVLAVESDATELSELSVDDESVDAKESVDAAAPAFDPEASEEEAVGESGGESGSGTLAGSTAGWSARGRKATKT